MQKVTVIVGDDQTYLNHFADKDPTVFFGFSTLGAFVDYVATLQRPMPYDKRDAGWRRDDDPNSRPGWYGSPSLAHALETARRGWTDGLALRNSLTVPRPRRKRRTHAVAGGTVNVGRLLAGNPAHMIRRERHTGPRTVTLFVQSSIWNGIRAETLIVRAFLIAAIVDLLEYEQYRCELVAIKTTMGADQKTGHHFAITVKSAGERLNLLDVSFALGHPSFSRRLMFAAVGASDHCATTWRHQGYVIDAFDDETTCAPNEFYIPTLPAIAQSVLRAVGPMAMLPFIEPDGLPVSLKDAL